MWLVPDSVSLTRTNGDPARRNSTWTLTQLATMVQF